MKPAIVLIILVAAIAVSYWFLQADVSNQNDTSSLSESTKSRLVDRETIYWESRLTGFSFVFPANYLVQENIDFERKAFLEGVERLQTIKLTDDHGHSILVEVFDAADFPDIENQTVIVASDFVNKKEIEWLGYKSYDMDPSENNQLVYTYSRNLGEKVVYLTSDTNLGSPESKFINDMLVSFSYKEK